MEDVSEGKKPGRAGEARVSGNVRDRCELRRAYAARRSCAEADSSIKSAEAAGLLSWKRSKTSLVVSCNRVFGLCNLRVALEANWQSWYRFFTWASAPKIKSERIVTLS